MARRVIFAPGGFGCSECQWTIARPKVGPWGRTSSRARGAQVRIAFNKHQCKNYQKEPRA